MAGVNILSIQSWVAYGHVGNASAVFPLQRLGAEVWAINTVQFSNHTGYGAWRGQVLRASLIRTASRHRGARRARPCDAVLSGYIGDGGIGAAILDAVARVKAVNPAALWCCDPVIGDVGRGVYVRTGIPDSSATARWRWPISPRPTSSRLEWLTGRRIATLADAKAADRRICRPAGRAACC